MCSNKEQSSIEYFLEVCKQLHCKCSERDENVTETRKELKYNGFNLPTLPLRMFYFNLRHITAIVLDKINLSSVPDRFGFAFPNLLHLSLNDNSLSKLPHTLCNLKNLKYLYLRNNNLYGLPELFCDLKRIEELDLSCNDFPVIPECVGKISSLIRLNFNKNNLQEVNNSISELKHLKFLDISHNYLTDLPIQLSKLTSLETLSIDTNSFSTIPAAICYLGSLKKLTASHNQIVDLPSHITAAKTLSVLHLNCNEIHHLPPWFHELSELKELLLFNNSLSADTFQSFKFDHVPNAEILDLSVDHMERCCEKVFDTDRLEINSLCNSIGKLCHLTDLNLSNILLKKLPENFGEIQALKTLNLSQNLIECLPSSFCKLFCLDMLDISNNYLGSLPSNFGLLSSLRSLILNNNKLCNIPTSFSNLKKLCYLDIHENNFNDFPQEIQELKALSFLGVDKNLVKNFKLECSVDLQNAISRGMKHDDTETNEFCTKVNEDLDNLNFTDHDNNTDDCKENLNQNDFVEENWDEDSDHPDQEDWQSDIVHNYSLKKSLENSKDLYNPIYHHDLMSQINDDKYVFCPGTSIAASIKPSNSTFYATPGQFEDAD